MCGKNINFITAVIGIPDKFEVSQFGVQQMAINRRNNGFHHQLGNNQMQNY